MPEVEVLFFAVEIGCGDDSNETAMEAHAALPDFKKVERVG